MREELKGISEKEQNQLILLKILNKLEEMNQSQLQLAYHS
jgi:hypothetical protein